MDTPRTRTGGSGRRRCHEADCETWSRADKTHPRHLARTTPYARRHRRGVPFFIVTIPSRGVKQARHGDNCKSLFRPRRSSSGAPSQLRSKTMSDAYCCARRTLILLPSTRRGSGVRPRLPRTPRPSCMRFITSALVHRRSWQQSLHDNEASAWRRCRRYRPLREHCLARPGRTRQRTSSAGTCRPKSASTDKRRGGAANFFRMSATRRTAAASPSRMSQRSSRDRVTREASMVQPCRAAATGRRRVTPSSSKGPAAGHGSRLLTAVS